MPEIYAVRSLNAGDLYRIGDMLRRHMIAIKGINTKPLPDESPEDHKQRVGKLFIEFLLDKCAPDMWHWLADMVGLDVSEFNKLPLDAPIDIIDQIRKGDDFKVFMKRLSDMLASK